MTTTALNIITWYRRQKISLQLLPFLFLYGLISTVFAPSGFAGDESRYIALATNISEGYYSPPYPNIKLWCGPGYPLLIAPFLAFGFPYLLIRLLNAILLYLSLIITNKSIRYYTKESQALAYTILLGIYYPIYHTLPLMHTEALAWFLISLGCLFILKLFKEERMQGKYLILSSLAFAFLVYTKVIFAYVVVLMILVGLLMFLKTDLKKTAVKTLRVFSLTLLLCLPYTLYTYQLTGKFFYWASSGGMSLYTMSTPYPNEYGDWRNSDKLSAETNHKAFMESIRELPPIERDEAFKKAAIQNIKTHPRKYIMNWFANIGRLLFHYPFSYKLQSLDIYFILLPNMFVFVLLAFSLPIGLRYYSRIPSELFLLLIIFMIYLFGSSLLSAYRRMFIITMPFWIIYISFFFSKIIRVNIHDDVG